MGVNVSRRSSFQRSGSRGSASGSRIDFKTIFTQLDTDGDGFVSQSEFVGALRRLITPDDRLNMDVDGDGDVDDDDLIKIFRIFDINGDGSASIDEFCAVLRAVEASTDSKLTHLQQEVANKRSDPSTWSPKHIFSQSNCGRGQSDDLLPPVPEDHHGPKPPCSLEMLPPWSQRKSRTQGSPLCFCASW